jgi:hypothetical protein
VVGAHLRQAEAGRRHILWGEAAVVHLKEELVEDPLRLCEGECGRWRSWSIAKDETGRQAAIHM